MKNCSTHTRARGPDRLIRCREWFGPMLFGVDRFRLTRNLTAQDPAFRPGDKPPAHGILNKSSNPARVQHEVSGLRPRSWGDGIPHVGMRWSPLIGTSARSSLTRERIPGFSAGENVSNHRYGFAPSPIAYASTSAEAGGAGSSPRARRGQVGRWAGEEFLALLPGADAAGTYRAPPRRSVSSP